MADNLNIKGLSKLIRLPNLLIIAAVQLGLYFRHILPFLASKEQVPQTTGWDAIFFSICTCCIAAGGNIVNDIIDQSSDAINRPMSRVVGVLMTEKAAIRLYIMVTFIGLMVALWLASHTGKWAWLWLYPTAVAILIVYSRILKCMPVVGNVVISFLCSAVFVSIAFLEWEFLIDHFWQGATIEPFWLAIIQFSWIAFVLTWARELVKDIEDMEGDLEAGCHTLVTMWGPTRSRWMVIGLLLVSIASVIMWMRSMDQWWQLLYVGIMMVLPLGVMITVLWTRSNQEVMRKASKHIKWVMLHAIIYLIFIS